MVTHSSILTWKIPQTEEPGGLQSMRLQSVGYDLVTEHAYKQKPEWKELMGIYPRAEFTRLVDTVQSLSRVWLFVTPWITACQVSRSTTNSRSLLKLMSIESVMPSSHLTLCHPLLLLPPIPPSIRVFSSESTLCMRWPNYWSLSFSISSSNEHPGLISFRMDWLYLLTVQGTFKSLLQNHSSKASILQPSACFMVPLSHPYMTTGKTIVLTRWMNLDSILKGRDITLPTKVHLVKAMVFPIVMHGCESWEEGWTPKNLCLWTVVLEKTLESPLDYKEIKPVNPKGNQS